MKPDYLKYVSATSDDWVPVPLPLPIASVHPSLPLMQQLDFFNCASSVLQLCKLSVSGCG